MFYLVGLGLFDEKDISLKGLECLKNVDKIYAEFFTSRLFGSSFDKIEELIGKEIEVLVRGEVEEEHKFIEEAKDSDVALITGGDPLIATTHSDFLVQCAKKGIKYGVIHGSSILSSAPAISGLQGYKFGKVTTIPFPDYNFYPKSPYVAIEENLKSNLHTLVLLDIQGKQVSSEQLAQTLEDWMVGGISHIVFIIGGSEGVTPEIKQRAHTRMSFGPITLPHNLARVVLLEQLYRAFKIQRGEPYHK